MMWIKRPSRHWAYAHRALADGGTAAKLNLRVGDVHTPDKNMLALIPDAQPAADCAARMHVGNPCGLYLRNELAEGRLKVNDHPLALEKVRVLEA